MTAKSGAKNIAPIQKKLQEKAISTIKFLPDGAPITNQMKKLKILKLKDFITLQNILFVKDLLANKELTSFNKIFQQLTATRSQNIRSTKTFHLREHDFKTEKYGHFLIINSLYQIRISYKRF